MFKIIIQVLIIYALAKKVNSFPSWDYNSDLSCPETCICYWTRNEIEINCPPPLPQIRVRVQPLAYVDLECSDLDESEYENIPKINVGDVSRVKIRGCPLPTGRSIKSILKNFGNTNMKSLTFQRPNTKTNSLNKQHLAGLEDLERITLRENGLSELPEDLFNDVTKLISLDLKSNKLNLQRNIFSNLKKLESLELGNNNLQYLEQGVFRNQKSLTLLNLWGNKLTNLTKETFDGVSSLLELDLSSNTIEEFQPDVFSTLTNLVNLNLNANHFKSLPEKLLKNNKKLIRIRIMDNRIPLETLPVGFLSNLEALEDVSIKCGLSTVPEDLFNKSRNITHINLDRNNLRTLPEKVFADQENLLHLNLNRNNLTHLPDGLLRTTRALIVLKLSYNQLTNISSSIFNHLESLTELYLDHNNLHQISRQAFTNLRSLEIISLQNNQLTLMDEFKIQNMEFDIISPFKDLTQLKRLNLRNNLITQIFPDWTTSLLELEYLDLSHNQIKTISSEDFLFISSKLNVNLTNNEINEIDLKLMATIALYQSDYVDRDIQIYLANNPINCNCMLLHFNKLIRNELSENTNKLVKIIPGNLKCAEPENLIGRRVFDVQPKELLCSFDSPQSSEKICPKNCVCMVRPEDRALLIDCSNAGLTKVPNLPNSMIIQFDFTLLNISNNQIKELPIISSESFGNVREIYAQNNNITKISIENIPDKLKAFDLSNNNLKEINSKIFEKFNKTDELLHLRLSGNPWKCNCETMDLLSFVWDKFKIIQDFNLVKCSTGEIILKMTDEDFCTK